MDSEILDVLQSLSDPGDLAGGICSYFKKHTARVRDILNYIVNNMPADPDDDGSTFDLGSGTFVLSNDANYVRSISLPDLTQAIRSLIQGAEEIPVVKVRVDNHSGGTTIYEDYTYDQVVQMMREQSDTADALITTLSGYKDWLVNPDLNFEQLMTSRVNNLISQNSVVAEKLKQGLTSVATRYSDSIRDYAPSVLHNLMGLFGVGTSTYTDQQVSTFSGINAWTVVLGDVIDGVTVILSNAPTFVGRLFGTIGYAIGKIVSIAANRLYAGTEKAVISLIGADDAFKSRGNGDGTVASSDWRYTADKSYFAVGDTQFQQLINNLDNFWGERDSNELSIPLFAGALNIQHLDSNRTGFNLQIKPLNCTAVEVAWNKTMNGSHLFYNLIQSSPGLISRNNSSDDYPSSLTMLNLIDFFAELAKNPQLYYLSQWKTDADAFMSCQCAKIVCFLQLLMMLDDNIPDPPGFVGMLSNCSDVADFDIENEPNYSSQYQNIEPSNYNMMKYLASFSRLTTAFNNSNGVYNDYTPNNFVSISSLNFIWRFLDRIIDTISQLDVLSSQGLTCFLPYQDNIVYRKSTFYIPCDNDNIDMVKGILKTGLTVAAVAAIVITGLVIRSSLKRKAFEMEAKAGSLSWSAADNRNPADMKKAYKLQRRASLLGNVAGYVNSGSVNSMNNMISTNGDVSAVLYEVRKLIAG